ncbi:MAG: hypothetical protein HQ537_01955 [Parcubacteria group bacterium]|nr:hypothetical protein [Parcubacteria group bacterium]
MEEKMMALIDLKCGCRGKCIEGKETGQLLPIGGKNQVDFNCRGCLSLTIGKIIHFGDNLKVSVD